MKYKISSCESDHHIFHSLIGEGWAAFISEYEDEAVGTLFINNKIVNPSIEENCFDDVLKAIETRLELLNKEQTHEECDATKAT